MIPRSICLLGGTGFLGTQLCARLAADGRRLTVLTRHVANGRHLQVLPSLRVLRADVSDPAQLAAAIAGHDAVVNLVGILNERGRGGAGFRAAHAGVTRALVTACRRARVDRAILVSALNADADHGASHYLRSKGEAERVLRNEGGPDLRWTVFRPSVMFGDGDSFTTRFARLLAATPVLPLARPHARLAPVWVGDVVAALQRALDDPATGGECFSLCGPDVVTLREVVCWIRDQLGLRRAVVGLPDPVGRLQALVMDFVPGKPFSTDNFRTLGVDSVCAESGFARLGLRPHALTSLAPAWLGGAGRTGRLDALRRSAGRA